jgi:hypothetical protein
VTGTVSRLPVADARKAGFQTSLYGARHIPVRPETGTPQIGTWVAWPRHLPPDLAVPSADTAVPMRTG